MIFQVVGLVVVVCYFGVIGMVVVEVYEWELVVVVIEGLFGIDGVWIFGLMLMWD